MNYYERHLGDYAKDTAHLSILEHGVYGLLLDRYYGTEAGIPEAQAHRLARARSAEEKQAVDDVLAEFFKLVDGVWINLRAEEEIAKAQGKINAAKENGKKGGRPPKDKSGYETETQVKPSGLSVGYETETQVKAHQAPSTRHQVNPNPIAAALDQPGLRELKPNAAAMDDPIIGRSIEITALLTKRGAAIQASNPTVRAWAQQGVTDTQALQALDIANERRQEQANPQPVNAGLLNAILGDIRDKPMARASPNGNRRQTLTEQRTETIVALTGKNRNHERTNATERDITGEAVRVA